MPLVAAGLDHLLLAEVKDDLHLQGFKGKLLKGALSSVLPLSKSSRFLKADAEQGLRSLC